MSVQRVEIAGHSVIRPFWGVLAVLVVAVGSVGCRQAIIRGADGEVYRLIENRQRASLGQSTDAHIGDETGALDTDPRRYSFNPRPVSAGVPESFAPPPDDQADAVASDDTTQELDDDAHVEDAPPDEALTPGIHPAGAEVELFRLRAALAYASRHARSLQTAREELYTAALDLTLERHLWTPQFVATASADYTDFEREAEFDQSMTAIADFAVTQRLPYGGAVTARVVQTLVRELNDHATIGESGQLILEADLPLFRGAGRVAYESRYLAERSLIYAARTYERFRRSFLVRVASSYFNLQQLKTAIGNTFTSYLSRTQAWEKAEFIERMGRSRTVFDAPRAKSILRQAEASLVSAKEGYASALDRFKILIGMSVNALLDVLDQDSDTDSSALDTLLPSVDVARAVDVALRYRLDLLNSADQVDDTERGVTIAENSILPDLDLRGSVTANSNPDHNRGTTFASERTTWSAGVELRLDDRKTERNAYRAALIALRRAERDHEEFRDSVRADVRRALRRIAQQENLLRIQALNVQENARRLAAADAQFDLGRSTNQDVVDAENDLLDARNDYARAIAGYRVAILELRRDTGTLRVGDDGGWDAHGPSIVAGVESESATEP